MVTKTTNGIKISVVTAFQNEYSDPINTEFVFAYKINISNNTEQTIKLVKRKWFIYDAQGIEREVEGDGVVGEQPVIPPLDDYEYVSGCHLSTEIGKMNGYYIMEHVSSGKQFKVKIPNFVLTADLKLN